jgi:alkaline phosphatase
MDEELDEAIRALAEIQMRQGTRLIILTADHMSGDVVVSVIGPESQKMSVYARVDRASGKLRRVLDT